MMLANDDATLTASDAASEGTAKESKAGKCSPHRDEDLGDDLSVRDDRAGTGESSKLSGAEVSSGATTGEQPEYAFSRRLVCLSAPHGAAATSYRSLQTHLSARHLGDGRRGLALVAPESGAGCTTVAVNLAIASAQAGINTLLIDANLGRPAVHDLIRPCAASSGLAKMLLAAGDDQEDAICRDIRPKLSVLFAGTMVPSARELVGGRRFKEIVEQCIRSFDFTIIDTPAASTGPGARQVAASVRYALMIARKNVTSVRSAQRSGGELAADRVKVVGSFLTDF